MQPGGPLPQAVGYGAWQAMSQLACQHDELAAVMTLVGHEVRQDVPEVQGQVTPHVGS